MTIWSATGHRPDKLGGYSFYKRDQFLELLAREMLLLWKPKKVISGMALGWDTAVAKAALQVRIPLIAAIAFEGQQDKWFAYDQETYFNTLSRAEHVETVSPGGYAAWKMIRRDFWMVDHTDGQILALYNGDLSGGTYATLSYAEHKAKQVVNVWPRFKAWSQNYQSSPAKPRKF